MKLEHPKISFKKLYLEEEEEQEQEQSPNFMGLRT